MTETIITHVRALEPGVGVVGMQSRIRDGKIAEIGQDDLPGGDVGEAINGDGRLLTPGLIDVHTHGIEQLAYEAGPEQLVAASRRLAQFGTTSVLPTLYRILSHEHLNALQRLAAALSSAEHVCMPGLHLEGPFLALSGAGARTLRGDVGLLDELLAAGNGKIAAMSVSPETPNILPVIERLAVRGDCARSLRTPPPASIKPKRPSTPALAMPRTFTTSFPPPKETDPGVRPAGSVEAILADPRCYGRLHRRRRPRASDRREGRAGGEGLAAGDADHRFQCGARASAEEPTSRRLAARCGSRPAMPPAFINPVRRFTADWPAAR